jgi:hypothetical protein
MMTSGFPRPDGTDLRQLTKAEPGQLLWNPRWTPDGSRITAADLSMFTGVWIDPATGAIEPFATRLTLARPQVRPLAPHANPRGHRARSRHVGPLPPTIAPHG